MHTCSGVLAVAAAAMGARTVMGVDKDDEILEHAALNAEGNPCARNVPTPRATSLGPC